MSLWSRLRNTLFPAGHDSEVNEEIEFHLAMKAREGHDLRQARLRFGNPTAIREQTRAMGIFEWLESVLQDARYGLRQLQRTPALTASIVVSLVIGIGANTAIFSIVDAALLKSLPVDDPASLQIVDWANQGWPKELCNSHTGWTDGEPEGSMRGSSFAPRLCRDLSRRQTAFSSLMGFSDSNAVGIVIRGRPPEQVNLQYVSDNFFQGLGVTPLLGRAFASGDDAVGREPSVVISHRLWQRVFGGSGDVLGQTLNVNSNMARIIGVAPPGFYGIQVGEWIDVYAPLSAQVAINPRQMDNAFRGEDDGYWWVRLIGRLERGANPTAATAQLSALYQRLVVPEGMTLEPGSVPTLVAHDGRRGFDPVGNHLADALWILMLLVGLILLIVCANVANLLLSRAVSRQRESAVRLALGAARLRLLRQQLVESTVMAALAGGIGLGLGYLLATWMQTLVRTAWGVGGLDIRPDLRILGYTAGISILTAFLFGLAPALRAARADCSDALQSHRRSVVAGRLRLPRALVVAQFALCLTVLVAAGLLGRTLANLKLLDVGFDRENIVYASVNPWRAGYQAERVGPFVERLRAELAAQPGVLGVALIENRLLSGSLSSTFLNVPGRPYVQNGSNAATVNHVSDGLLELLRIPLAMGRTLGPSDIRPGSSAVVVDEVFVEKVFPQQNPLGQRFGTGPDHNDLYEIVGVVKSSRYESLRRELSPAIYRPFLPQEMTGRNVHFVIRAAIDSQQLATAVRQVADSIDPDVPLVEIETQTALIDRLLHTERLLSIFSAGLGAIALVLSAVGLAGLLAYVVARRTNEIGIRMALGAAPRDVVRMVLGDSLWLVGAGVLIGLPGAYAIGRVLKSALFGLQPADLATTAAGLSVLTVIAALAAWLPARRAARIDPMAALRDE